MHGISTDDDETGATTAADAGARAGNRLEAWLMIAVGIGGATLAVCLGRHG